MGRKIYYESEIEYNLDTNSKFINFITLNIFLQG